VPVRTFVLDKGQFAPLLQKYTHPTSPMVTRNTSKKRYLDKYEAMPEKQKREAYLVALMMIAEAVATLRSKGDSVSAEHRF
jgi:hypothetical protein